MAKNVLQKYWDGTKYTEIHPVTKSTNVFNSEGKSIQEQFDEHKADNTQHVTYAVTTGTSTKYVLTLNPAPNHYIEGMRILVRFHVESGNGATINVNGLGNKFLYICNDNADQRYVMSGDLTSNNIYEFVYYGDGFFLVNGKALSDLPKVKKVARFVIGTSTSGWTEKDCDYLCDGTADDAEIIQALNDLPATGGEVVILDGTYNITASINIPKDNVSLRGNGNATILKRMYDSTNTDSGSTAKGLITLNEKSGCKIQGLQIDGNKAAYTASYNCAIYLYSSTDNTITGNTYSNNGCGIRLYSSSNNIVTDNICSNNSYYGIYLYLSSNNNTITDNTCSNNNHAIYLYSSCNENTITGNTCSNNNSGNGIYLYSSCNNNVVTGNTYSNNGYGIRLHSSSNNTITGNICNNNSYDGIYLYYSSNNNTVTGNTCNNNEYNIYLDASSNNTVTGNTCIRGTGLSTDYTASQHTIRLNDTNTNYNLIAMNNCMGKAPVVDGGTGNTLVNNKFNET